MNIMAAVVFGLVTYSCAVEVLHFVSPETYKTVKEVKLKKPDVRENYRYIIPCGRV